MAQSEKQKLWKKEHYRKNKQLYIDKQRDRKLEIKEFISTLKTKCSICTETDSASLDFHHLDGDTKDENVSNAIRDKWGNERILLEVEKCIVLCSNCHRKLHAYNLSVEELRVYVTN